MKIEYFNIFPNKKEKDKQPDYKISFKSDTGYEEIGACWKKTGTSGAYLSCKIDKNYVLTITNPAIVADETLKKEAVKIETERIERPKEDINSDDIPF